MKKNTKGFTLAELLVVVAIIAVLVAISIPVFTAQLEKSRDAVSIANIRAAYAEASTQYLTMATPGDVTISGVVLKGTESGWSSLDGELPFTHTTMTDPVGGAAGSYTLVFTWTDAGVCSLKTITKAS